MGMNQQQFLQRALPQSPTTSPVQNFGMQASGAPMPNGIPNSQVVLTDQEIQNSPWLGQNGAATRNPNYGAQRSAWATGGREGPKPSRTLPGARQFNEQGQAIDTLRDLAGWQSQQSYNQLQGGGNTGGMIGSNYSQPWAGTATGGAAPGALGSWPSGWGAAQMPGAWGGNSGVSPALSSWQSGNDDSGSTWGGAWGAQNAWGAGS
jgi:hypothetical protein